MSAERKVEVSSSFALFKPERLFWILGNINKSRYPDDQVAAEVYPVHYCYGVPLGPGLVTSRKIWGWQKDYGPVPIERFHLPFHWSVPSALYNYFYYSIFVEPGPFVDRAIASGLAAMTTTVQNKFAIKLAGEFGAGLTTHVNIAEEAGKRNKVQWLRGGSEYIWVENDVDYPRKRPEHILRERDPQRAIRAVEDYRLDGVIIGVDHDFYLGIDPLQTLTEKSTAFSKHLRAVHLSGSKGHHGIISEDDHDFWRVVDFIKREDSFDNVRFCVDLSPFALRHLTPDQQLDYIKDLVTRLEE